jgi:hypothetical protein
MRRFKKILLVSREGPGERATLARAVELAKRNRARLTLVEVVDKLRAEPRSSPQRRQSACGGVFAAAVTQPAVVAAILVCLGLSGRAPPVAPARQSRFDL